MAGDTAEIGGALRGLFARALLTTRRAHQLEPS